MRTRLCSSFWSSLEKKTLNQPWKNSNTNSELKQKYQRTKKVFISVILVKSLHKWYELIVLLAFKKFRLLNFN